MSHLIGYARVSTTGQSLDDQLKKLTEVGCSKIFEGKHSGRAETNKKSLEDLLEYVRDGDTVVVTKLDRLGRSLKQVLNTLEVFTSKGVSFKVLDQKIDTSNQSDPLSTAMVQLLGMFAELERNFIVQRTTEGKVASGNFGGRPSKLSEEDKKQILKSNLNNSQLAKKYDVSRATIISVKKRA